MLAAAIGMVYTIIEQFADKVQQNADTNDVLTDAGSLLAVSIIVGILVWRMPQISAAMTGGTTVEGIGQDIGKAMANAFNGGGRSSTPQKSGGGAITGSNAASSTSPAPAPAQTTAAARSSGGAIPMYQRHVVDNIRSAAS